MSAYEGSNWQAKKQDEGKPLFEKELTPDEREQLRMGRIVRGEKPVKSDWISVEERFPQIGDTILSFGENGIKQTKYATYPKESIGYAEGKTDCWFEYVSHNNYIIHHSKVTHWQPLPSPPDKK